jgi:hypothetical protein
VKTRETVEVNGVTDLVKVHHTIVSKDYALRSTAGDATVLSPKDLPECDTLAIDADSAELDVLESLSSRPHRLIVEHHAVSGEDEDNLVVEYQPDTVRSSMEEMGYQIVEELADPDRA